MWCKHGVNVTWEENETVFKIWIVWSLVAFLNLDFGSLLNPIYFGLYPTVYPDVGRICPTSMSKDSVPSNCCSGFRFLTSDQFFCQQIIFHEANKKLHFGLSWPEQLLLCVSVSSLRLVANCTHLIFLFQVFNKSKILVSRWASARPNCHGTPGWFSGYCSPWLACQSMCVCCYAPLAFDL